MQSLGLERVSAAARLNGIRIIEGESASFDRFVPIQCRAVQIQVALTVHDNLHAMLFVLGVVLVVESFIELQHVIEATAAARRNPKRKNTSFSNC